MKNQSLILVFVFSLVTTFAVAQAGNKTSDSVNSARQIILKNSGEKNLTGQIKKEQVSKSPELLGPDSSNTPVNAQRAKDKSNKQKKG
jgi:hypothetical protein